MEEHKGAARWGDDDEEVFDDPCGDLEDSVDESLGYSGEDE